jgi:hypothetical protein
MLYRPLKFIFMTVLAALAIALLAPSAIAGSKSLDISTVKAPVAPDGTTAGAVTDFVINFKNLDPSKKGEKLRAGDTVEVVLSDAFVSDGSTPTGPPGNFVIILQGWPQSPAFPFPWTTGIVGNTITLTLTGDYRPGDFGPGPKQVHLLLRGFTNPALPGVYPVELTITKNSGKKSKGSKGSKSHSGTGHVRIIPDARPNVNPISLFSGPPGPPPPFFNPLYQTLELGEAARQVGLYLWAANSAAFTGVDVTPTPNPSYYQLTDAALAVVGEVWIIAPAGANAYSLSSVALPPGGPPSILASAFATGVDVGLLGIQFTPDSAVAGDYEIAISMKGGNETTLFVTVDDGKKKK